MSFRAITLCAAIMLAGCNGSQPTLDTSSEKAFNDSLRAMVDAEPPERKDLLVRSVMHLTIGRVMQDAGLIGAAEIAKRPDALIASASWLKGKTAKEIISIAEKTMAKP